MKRKKVYKVFYLNILLEYFTNELIAYSYKHSYEQIHGVECTVRKGYTTI